MSGPTPRLQRRGYRVPPLQRIGRYHLDGLIGQGGTGIVYRSTHPVLGRPVAIKALHEKVAHDPQLQERLLCEARVTRDLTHPGIVNLYDVDQDGERAFFVMEWFAHGSLADALSQQHLPLPWVLDVAAAIADALAFAHRRGVVHGDVKPSNVLLRADGTPVVADFGLATDGRTSATTVATGGTVLGTPAYMAPEQLRGRHSDSRSDVYAFGVMLYELVTGRRPFAGAVELLVHHHLTVEPVALRELNPSVPGAVDTLVARLLAKDPARRPAGMTEVAARLRAIRRAQPPTDVVISVPAAVPPAPAGQQGTAAGPTAEPVPPSSATVTTPVGPAEGLLHSSASGRRRRRPRDRCVWTPDDAQRVDRI